MQSIKLLPFTAAAAAADDEDDAAAMFRLLENVDAT